jgi:uncharacterized membrane protein YphA (DoxX/SURF4 family)
MIMMWVEVIFRWILGLQLVFWGLNSIFHWRPIPPSSAAINDFTEACIKTKFIMPTVKLIEIAGGLLLLAGFHIDIALTALAPLIFVITGLHVLFNKKSWEVLIPITLPYLVLMIALLNH